MSNDSKTRILISMGTGGVGKTTLSAATAVALAMAGKKVVVLTIDPSQRLKDTLEIQNDGRICEVPWPEVRGRLFGVVLNSKKVFDEFVTKAVQSDQAAQKLFANPLYQKLSTSLSGSQEFTALEQLYQLVKSGQFDWVIVDTPPAQHAFEFLSAPQRLAALFQDGVAVWFRGGWLKGPKLLQRVIQSGTQKVLKGLELLTGAQFMKQLADFFVNISSWQGQMDLRLADFHRLLVGEQTQFQLVLTADAVQRAQAAEMIAKLRREGFHLNRLLLNRAQPKWLQEDPSGVHNHEFSSEEQNLRLKMLTYYHQREASVKDLLQMGLQLVRVPENFEEDFATSRGLFELAKFVDVDLRGKS